jgi:heterodisulfide reductase subunit B
MSLSGKLLNAAKDIGAEALVTACPLCQMNLDLRQDQINSANGANHNIPVFYYTQLIGLALGLGEKELGIDKLCVSPRKVINGIGVEDAS